MDHPQRYEHFPARIGPKGRLVVPAALRHRLGVKPGHLVTFTIDREDPLGIPRLTTADQEIELGRRSLGFSSRGRRRRRA